MGGKHDEAHSDSCWTCSGVVRLLRSGDPVGAPRQAAADCGPEESHSRREDGGAGTADLSYAHGGRVIPLNGGNPVRPRHPPSLRHVDGRRGMVGEDDGRWVYCHFGWPPPWSAGITGAAGMVGGRLWGEGARGGSGKMRREGAGRYHWSTGRYHSSAGRYHTSSNDFSPPNCSP